MVPLALLIHVTVVPTVIVSTDGLKDEFCIVTVFVDCEVHPDTATAPKIRITPKTKKFDLSYFSPKKLIIYNLLQHILS